MSKKIRDLTDKEIDKICNKQMYCSDCPLYLGEDSDNEEICLRYNYDAFEKALEIADKSIEIEESKNGGNR